MPTNTPLPIAPPERTHTRHASAPAGFANLAACARASVGVMEGRKAGGGQTSPRSVTQGESSSSLAKLKGWWDERVKRQQALACNKGKASGLQPMPAFLEDAFENDTLELEFDQESQIADEASS